MRFGAQLDPLLWHTVLTWQQQASVTMGQDLRDGQFLGAQVNSLYQHTDLTTSISDQGPAQSLYQNTDLTTSISDQGPAQSLYQNTDLTTNISDQGPGVQSLYQNTDLTKSISDQGLGYQIWSVPWSSGQLPLSAYRSNKHQ